MPVHQLTTRDRLVRAGREVIEENGYAGAFVTAVADRAGVSAGALYRHFSSKAELFVEVFREVAHTESAALQAAGAIPGNYARRLESVIRTYAVRALRNRRLAWALVYEPVDPLVAAERLVFRRAYRDGMASLIRAAVAAGECPGQDADLTAAAVVGAIAEALVSPMSPDTTETESDDAIVAGIVRFCHQAIGMRGSTS